MGAWEKCRTLLRDWKETREIGRQKVLADMRDADKALDLYARAHPQPRSLGAKPQWRSYYKPTKAQKTGEMVFVGGATLGGAYILSKVFPQGYWKGFAAIAHLAAAAAVSEDVARAWLSKQALWQIYLPPPWHIPRPRFDISVPNEVHEADLLFLPHDRPGRGRKLYKYALTVVDVASRYKEAEPLATKESREVAAALEKIYKWSHLSWPKLLQVDPGREFMGVVNPLLEKHSVSVRRGRVDIHSDQAIVERFNRTLSERLFGHQYAQEMPLQSEGDRQRSVEWVARLPAAVAALNNEVTHLLARKPGDAIQMPHVEAKPSDVVPGRLVGLAEQRLSSPEARSKLASP
ncbi:hypothetical protein QZH41_005205 [Actinostola sp. cb2023]|nr:hypothetical protein QZH41_005205 [Actinostola sp. cb2023]